MTGAYRLLLRLYPRWFRQQYERELVEAFEADRSQHRDPLALIGFWLFIASDLAVSAWRIRWTAGAAPPPEIDPIPRRRAMEALAQDFHHAFRQLVRRPG